MDSAIRLTPLYGSQYSEQGDAERPDCVLLEVSGCRILINVGWHTSLPEAFPEHDCVFVLSSTLQSLGALPQYHARYPHIPIYATFPVIKMGQMTLYDAHSAICLDGGAPPFSLAQIDNVFGDIHAIKFSQQIQLYGNYSNVKKKHIVSVTAYPAGHVVGGCFLSIQRLLDETKIVYTGIYNISRELHLNSAQLLQYGHTPDVLITIPGGAANYNVKKLNLKSTQYTQAEQQLTESILSTLRRDGNVLLPVDASGRVLELLLCLDKVWEVQKLSNTYSLVWLAPMNTNTIEFARSQLEWMAKALGTQFDNTNIHPLNLKCVKIINSMSELANIESNQNPVCCLASGLSLEDGLSRDAFLKYADNPDNVILLTDTSQCCLRQGFRDFRIAEANEATTGTTAAATAVPVDNPDAVDESETAIVGDILDVFSRSPWTTAGQLLLAWYTAKANGREMDDSVTVDVNERFRKPLAGVELKEFLEAEETERIKEQARKEKETMLKQVELAKGQLHLGEEREDKPAAVTTSVKKKATTVAVRPRKRSRFDSSLFLKFSKPLHLTFEIRETAVGIGQDEVAFEHGLTNPKSNVVEDDYGISVQHDRFTDIVSGVDPSRFAGGSGRLGEDVMRRGLGYANDSRPANRAAAAGGTTRVVSEDEEVEKDDTLDNLAMEILDLSEGNGIIRGRSGRPPMRVSCISKKLEVLAEVSYIPGLEGRVDGRAARQSVRALQPREVIVLGGPRRSSEGESDGKPDQVMLLADAAKSFATGSKNIWTPSDGDVAELIVGHAAFSARILNIPYQTPEEKELEDGPLDPIEPYESKLGGCTVGAVDCIATGQTVKLDDSIVLAPRRALTDSDSSSIYLSDGDILLTDLRAEIIASGMKAEYSARAGFSQLVVNEKVIVKKGLQDKDDSGRISIEGPLCEDFYKVRSIVNGQYVTLLPLEFTIQSTSATPG